MTTKICLCLLYTLVIASPSWAQNFTQTPTRTDDGAILGGVTGAIIGGIAGNQNDETIEGVAIGGVVGAVAGGLLGRSQDQQAARNFQFQQQQLQREAQLINQSVSMSDVIALTRSGVSTNLIINQIRTNGVRQQIGVQEILYLHQNGVTEPVIQEMQKIALAGSAVVTGPAVLTGPAVVAGPPVVARPVVTGSVIVGRPYLPPVKIKPTVIVKPSPTYRRPPYYGQPQKKRYNNAGRGPGYPYYRR